MCVLFWFVVHLCQTLKNAGNWKGSERIRIVRVHILFKAWIIALENILVVYMFLVEILCSVNRKPLYLYCEPH